MENQSRNREIKLAQVSLVIVFGKKKPLNCNKITFVHSNCNSVFIFCHSIKWIPNVWELKQSQQDEDNVEWPVWIGQKN